ncbi:MAG: BrnT family toxin [Bryobacteraceae bacterium]|nr:BrnT family toxin [Bryobacteraceae bacterium]
MTRFEWDSKKNTVNRRKHGIEFELATLVFDDPNHISFVSNTAESEENGRPSDP